MLNQQKQIINIDHHFKLTWSSTLMNSPVSKDCPRFSNSDPVVRLVRISHHPATATVPCHALWAFYSVRVLDIVSTMPAGPLVVKSIQAASSNRLATKSGEKCGLER